MNICVYGAASDKIDEVYKKEGEKLGEKMAKRGHSLVFGGGAKGMMGAVARGVYSANGEIVSVAPKFFNVDGLLFDNCGEYIYTDTMRQRKQTMEDRSDAFIITPGGIGTLDEFMEIFTLRQLQRHEKPIAILNINGFYDSFIDFINSIVEKDFVSKETMSLCYSSSDIDKVLDFIENPPKFDFSVEKLRNL